jgi:hypothetical protein
VRQPRKGDQRKHDGDDRSLDMRATAQTADIVEVSPPVEHVHGASQEQCRQAKTAPWPERQQTQHLAQRGILLLVEGEETRAIGEDDRRKGNQSSTTGHRGEDGDVPVPAARRT